MKTVLKFAAGVVVLGTAALLLFPNLPRPADVAATGKSTLVPSVTSVAKDLTPAKTEATPTVTAVVRAPVSKAAEFDRLVRTGKPADALAGYKLAATCEAHSAWGALAKQAAPEVQRLANLKSPEEACGDLSPGQRATRLELLRIANEAGVHGALAALVSTEGPNGVLKTIPDGPAWHTLESAAIEAAVKTADPYALISRSGYYMNCHNTGKPCVPTDEDKALALMYWVAYQASQALDKQSPMPGSDAVLARYSQSLPPEVVEKAIADGKTLVATARGQQ
jgi:hypothetical protein